MVCAALPPSLQQTKCTYSKQVGPVAARPSKTPCSAVELARCNGPSVRLQVLSSLGCTNAEVGPRPRGLRVNLGF